MSISLFDTVIEIEQTQSRAKAEKALNKAIQRGFDVSCTVDGWNIYHVRTSHIDRCKAIGIYQRMQKAGFNPVML